MNVASCSPFAGCKKPAPRSVSAGPGTGCPRGSGQRAHHEVVEDPDAFEADELRRGREAGRVRADVGAVDAGAGLAGRRVVATPAEVSRLLTVSVESVRPIATYVPAMGAGQPSIEAWNAPVVRTSGMSAAGAWSNGSDGSVQSLITQPLTTSPVESTGCSGEGASFGSGVCAQ